MCSLYCRPTGTIEKLKHKLLGQFGPSMDVAGGLIQQDLIYLTTKLNLYAINSVLYLHCGDYNFDKY